MIDRAMVVLSGLLVCAGIALMLLFADASRSDGRIAQLERDLDSLETVAARIDTLYLVQRDTFYLRRDRLDTLTITVESWKHDTVQVVEYVQRADSTVKACSAVLLTCEAQVANRDARIAKLDSLGTENAKVARAQAWRAAGVAVVVWEGIKLLVRRQ